MNWQCRHINVTNVTESYKPIILNNIIIIIIIMTQFRCYKTTAAATQAINVAAGDYFINFKKLCAKRECALEWCLIEGSWQYINIKYNNDDRII